MYKLAMLFALALPLEAFGQGVVTVSPQQCVWRADDNLAWAVPNLDESGWQPYAQWKPHYSQTRFWVRCHLDPAAFRNLEHPAVQIRALTAYEAFFNGVSMARNGNLENGNFGMNSIQVFPFPRTLEHDPDVLALHVVQRFANGTPPEIHLGDERALNNDRAGYLLGIIPSAFLEDLPFIVIGIVSLVLVVFSLSNRSRPEAILFGVSNVAAGLLFLDLLLTHLMLNEPVWLSLGLLAIEGTVSIVTQFWFFFALARRRVPAVFWLPMSIWIFSASWQLAELFVPLRLALQLDHIHAAVLAPSNFSTAVLLGAAPLVAFWPWNRIPRPMRAIAWFSLAWGVTQSLFFAAILTSINIPGIPNVLQDWMLPVSTITQFFVIAAIIALILRDQRHIALQRASLAGEMQAAGEIQRMLAPAAIESAPGLRIDVAFHPMREVGGDFYLCRVLFDGRQRVLLGDVSGKGAAAAMAAALLLGAAAARDSDSPATLLAHLNRVLLENHLSGFATCLCADLAHSGAVTLANAGHLPPYLAGSEIILAPCLPLGIATGTSLTFLSDGVVEARNPSGELFGFDRARDLSTESAQNIARAASTFGQEDDITVLTLTRLGSKPPPTDSVARPTMATS